MISGGSLVELLRSRYAPTVKIDSVSFASSLSHGLATQMNDDPKSVFHRRIATSALDSAIRNRVQSFCTAR